MLAKPTTTLKPQIFSEQERDSVGYFFLRMSNIYTTEYDRQFRDHPDRLKMVKREWGKDIGKYSREQINNGCDWIHQQKINHEDGWQFMDIGRCIGAIKQANTVKAAHKIFEHDRALEDLGAKERAAKAGSNELLKMKELFS